MHGPERAAEGRAVAESARGAGATERFDRRVDDVVVPLIWHPVETVVWFDVAAPDIVEIDIRALDHDRTA